MKKLDMLSERFSTLNKDEMISVEGGAGFFQGFWDGLFGKSGKSKK